MNQDSLARQYKRGWLERLYAWACERLYDEFAWAYDLVSWVVSAGRWSRWRQAALDYLPPTANQEKLRTLELGFGTGELLINMSRADQHVVGLELSSAMQRVTARKLQRKTLKIPRVQASAQQIPFASASFDAIISTFPAPYILDPSTLSECARILAPNGRLIIVGLWTTLEHPWLQKITPLFYGEPNQVMRDAVSERLARVDLHAEFLHSEDGVVRVSVVVASKRA